MFYVIVGFHLKGQKQLLMNSLESNESISKKIKMETIGIPWMIWAHLSKDYQFSLTLQHKAKAHLLLIISDTSPFLLDFAAI